jgi:hypothetical protein
MTHAKALVTILRKMVIRRRWSFGGQEKSQ